MVTGATARRTVLISSSVTGDTLALLDEAEAFGVGFEEDGVSSLILDVFVSYANNKTHHLDTYP